jgi:hypothetical protein
VKVHYLPTYSPDCNPVARVWWRLHGTVTRNHRCQTMRELLDLTFDWFATRIHFRFETDEASTNRALAVSGSMELNAPGRNRWCRR